MRTLLVLAGWLAATLPSWGEGPVIVAFGDSITLGAGVKPDESYPARLEALLRARPGLGQPRVHNAGVGGDTVLAGLARLEADVLAHHPQFVLIGFGMNDSVMTAVDQARVPAAQFADALRTMVQRVQAADATAVLATVTPVLEDYYYERHPRAWYPEGLQAQLDRYRTAIRAVARETKAPLVDLALLLPPTALRTPENSGARDGVHPTPEGHALIAAAYAKLLEPLLVTALFPRDRYVIPDTAAFLRLLDFRRPELAPVQAALDRGEVATAGAAYVAHFRQKTIASPLLADWRTLARNPQYNTAGADRILAGHLMDGYSVHDLPPGESLNWRESPLSCVTRFPLLPPVRTAYHHTRQAKYARWLTEHLLGFVQAWPMAEYLGHNSHQGWTSHTTVARPWYWCMVPERLQEMAQTLNLLRDSPEVTDDELLTLLRRLLEECGYCRQEIRRWVVEMEHNGGCAMIEGLAMACAVLDDFRPAQEYLAYDAEMAAAYLDQAFYPDGMCVELTTAYSLGTSFMTQRFCHALRDTPAMRQARAKVAALVTCLVGLSEPGGGIPSFGDLYAGPLRSGVSPEVARWLELPWVETLLSGKDGPLPPFTNWPLPGQDQWCGYYAMRSDWGKTARYLCIDGGPWGTTHQHGDRLSFVVTAHGARFIIDPSSTRYASNRPGAFISRQIASFLHNTVTVDGVDEFQETPPFRRATEPLQNTWDTGTKHTLFVGNYSFAPVKPVHWQRRVLFAGREYWLLQDVLTGEQPEATVEQNFQFEADIKVAFEGNRTVATAPNGAKLLLLPLVAGLKPVLTVGDREPHTTYWPDGKPKLVQCIEDGVEQKHGRGWTGRSTDELIPAPAVTYTGRVTLPATFTLLLVPLAPGQDVATVPAVTSRTEGDATIWTLPTAAGPVSFVSSLSGCHVTP